MHKDLFNSNHRPEDRISSNYWDKKILIKDWNVGQQLVNKAQVFWKVLYCLGISLVKNLRLRYQKKLNRSVFLFLTYGDFF